ncbi:MAG: amino acid racemase [Acidobacteriota bacterium]|nr:amino acid racemase [Acidobacteriota bacterium]
MQTDGRIAGLIGGTGPESTIDYYKQIIARWRDQPGRGYPRLVITSIDLDAMLPLVRDGHLGKLADLLLIEIERLAAAGASFAALTANTPHIVFDDLRARSPLPLISIVEVTRDEVVRLGFKRPLLLGTRFTMTGRFYAKVFEGSGADLSVPGAADQDYIHEKYISELIPGIFLPATRDGLLAIVRRIIAEQRVDAIVLGGTELPLILTGSDVDGVPLVDTTAVHVREIVAELAR